jgi:hypothetical protein
VNALWSTMARSILGRVLTPPGLSGHDGMTRRRLEPFGTTLALPLTGLNLGFGLWIWGLATFAASAGKLDFP